MPFSISDFVRVNRVYFIWVIFAALLYLFRDMFGLLFITYIMCFITSSITHALRRRFRWNRRFIVVSVYVIFLTLVTAFLVLMPPRLLSEAIAFTEQIPHSVQAIRTWIDANLGSNEFIAPILARAKTLVTPETAVLNGWGIARAALEKGLHYFSWFFIAMLFSFLIMLDLPRLSQGVRQLRFTRLAEAYHETADSIALFAKVVGGNFRAQLFISTVNTILTAICLQILGVKAAALLCTLVFLCGLIPVLGVFISSVPIVLMAINSGGIELGLWAVLMIIVIHLIEAYVLNPRIVSSVMHINPVMTLIILYIAHSVMGMWGMLLGVPIAVYIYRKISKPREIAAPVRQKQTRAIPYARRCTKCRASRYRKPVSAPVVPAPRQGGGILKMLAKLKKR
jgi:predicted PurR-regulated permease PerM